MTSPFLHIGRNAALDGLRGWAAIIVVLYHAILNCSPDIMLAVLNTGILQLRTRDGWILKTVISALSGEIAVTLFFVMSGMVLFRALSVMERAQGAELGIAWRFLIRRVLRLWPPMATCLAVGWLLYRELGVVAPGLTAVLPVVDLVDNLALVDTRVNGATWTLGVELGSAPWLLLFYFAIRRWGALRTSVVAAVGVAALFRVGLLDKPAGMIFGLPAILAGAVLEHGWAERLSRVWGALPMGLALMFVGEMLFPLQDLILHTVTVGGGAALVVAAMATATRGRVHFLLTSGVSRFLGRISYSLYLWNVPILIVSLGAIGRERARVHPLDAGVVLGLSTVLLTIPVAMLAERWTERPFTQLGRALTRPAGAARGELSAVPVRK